MRTSAIVMTATTTLFGMSAGSWADEPTNRADGAAAKLYSAGYSQVRLVDADRQLFSAYDSDGSEVTVIVDATSSSYFTVNYVHAADE